MVNGNLSKAVTILIAEDDDGHAELIISHLQDSGINNNYYRFKDGLELWEFLDGQGRNGEAFLILLDLRMPRMDGLEVLKLIKEDSLLAMIPVIILTTTDNPKEIAECYQYGCNCYIIKPVRFQEFTETLKRLGLFLLILSVAELADGSS